MAQVPFANVHMRSNAAYTDIRITILVCYISNRFLYIFTFTISEPLITTCPKLIILEKSNSKYPFDSSDESYLLINNTITNYNYDNITQISEYSVQYYISDCVSNLAYLVLKIEQECSITITNNTEIQISVGNNRILPNDSRTTIYFEGLVLIKISGIVNNLDITITLN